VASGNTVSVTAATQEQGTNSSCIFLGRAVMFAIPGTDPEQYITHTLVGRRNGNSTDAVTSLQEAGTRTVNRGTSPYGTTHPEGTTYYDRNTLQHGLSVKWMMQVHRDGATGVETETPVVGVAFVLPPGSQGGYSSGVLQSGSLVSAIIGVPRGTLAASPGVSIIEGAGQVGRALGEVNPSLAVPTVMNPTGGIQICFLSGTTDNQSAKVTIGAQKSNTSVDYQIYYDDNCGA
jgi:hypothetical protein